MQLAACAVPKKTMENDTEDGLFCSLREKVEELMAVTAGKVLFVSDETSFPALAFAARLPRAVSVVTEGDALPLFAMPETAAVVAAGHAGVMRAARLFARVRKNRCLLFPTDPSFGGAYGEGEVKLGSDTFCYPLAEGEVYWDETLLSDYAEGYARLLLCRLALFEQAALARFNGGERPPEEAFGVLMDLGETSPREILLKNAALRRLSASEGEGRILAERVGNFSSFEALTKLYVAFFRCGAPQKYVVPAYEARAKAAGIPFRSVNIPTEEVYTHRALVLGGRRGEFLRELGLITQKNATYRRVYRSLGGTVKEADVKELKYLPERSNGLSAVIRDFGLMEKL